MPSSHLSYLRETWPNFPTVNICDVKSAENMSLSGLILAGFYEIAEAHNRRLESNPGYLAALHGVGSASQGRSGNFRVGAGAGPNRGQKQRVPMLMFNNVCWAETTPETAPRFPVSEQSILSFSDFCSHQENISSPSSAI